MCDCGLVFVCGGGVCSATLLEVVRAFKHSHMIYVGIFIAGLRIDGARFLGRGRGLTLHVL